MTSDVPSENTALYLEKFTGTADISTVAVFMLRK
jgi:hypothetical protein